MTIEEASKERSLAEYEIKKILDDLNSKTGCRVSAVSLTHEEAFGIIPEVITGVNIKLEII